MIELKNVSKSYGHKAVLNHINLTIKPGEVTFIVGTSGAGKSTLLNLIGGLDNVSSGEIFYENRNIKEDLIKYRSKNVGFVFQDYNLISGLSVGNNIKLATELSGTPYSNKDVELEVERLGIKDIKQKAETLSGGEKQRVAIIRSICKSSDVIIADEPTGNLDSENADLVLSLLSKLKKDKHIIVVSHDLEKSQKFGDRIITLKDGEIKSDVSQNRTKSKGSIQSEDNLSSNKKDIKHFLASIFILGVNSIHMRKSKMISIALVLAIAICSIAMVINFNASGDQLSHNVNVNYLETDLINLYYKATPNTGFMEMPFSDKTISDLQTKYAPIEAVNIFQIETSTWLFSAADRTAEVCLKQINIDDFFRERVMSNEIEGEFITNSNEIILAKDVAADLFEGDCIGETVSVNDGAGESVDVTIVGINHTVNPFDKIYSFVSSSKIKELLAEQINSTLYKRMEVNLYFTEIQGVNSSGIYGAVKEFHGNENILYGTQPQDATDVMISTELAQYSFDSLGITNEIGHADFEIGVISDSALEELFNKKLAINFNGLFQVQICGIYESAEIEMTYTAELISELLKIEPIAMDIYIATPNSAASTKEVINDQELFTASTQLENLKNHVSIQTRFFSLALIILDRQHFSGQFAKRLLVTDSAATV